MSELPIFKFALREDIKDQKQFLPSRTESKATCWDVKAAFPDRNDLILKPFQRALIPLGFRTFCPEGWWFRLNPRSSTYGKKHLGSLYGIIDETYEGELLFACQYLPDLDLHSNWSNLMWDKSFSRTLTIKFGESIGQIYPVKRDEMIIEEVSNEEYDLLCKNRNGERGIGGFGSSDGQK
jgi:dUTPase